MSQLTACRPALGIDQLLLYRLRLTCPSAASFPQIAAQMAAAPLAVAGMRVHASQLHAPSCLFLGDAGHGVSRGRAAGGFGTVPWYSHGSTLCHVNFAACTD